MNLWKIKEILVGPRNSSKTKKNLTIQKAFESSRWKLL